MAGSRATGGIEHSEPHFSASDQLIPHNPLDASSERPGVLESEQSGFDLGVRPALSPRPPPRPPLTPSQLQAQQFVREAHLQNQENALTKLTEKLFELLEVPANADRLDPVVIGQGIASRQRPIAMNPLKTAIQFGYEELTHQQGSIDISQHTRQNVEALETAFRNVDIETLSEAITELIDRTGEGHSANDKRYLQERVAFWRAVHEVSQWDGKATTLMQLQTKFGGSTATKAVLDHIAATASIDDVEDVCSLEHETQDWRWRANLEKNVLAAPHNMAEPRKWGGIRKAAGHIQLFQEQNREFRRDRQIINQAMLKLKADAEALNPSQSDYEAQISRLQYELMIKQAQKAATLLRQGVNATERACFILEACGTALRDKPPSTPEAQQLVQRQKELQLFINSELNWLEHNNANVDSLNKAAEAYRTTNNVSARLNDAPLLEHDRIVKLQKRFQDARSASRPEETDAMGMLTPAMQRQLVADDVRAADQFLGLLSTEMKRLNELDRELASGELKLTVPGRPPRPAKTAEEKLGYIRLRKMVIEGSAAGLPESKEELESRIVHLKRKYDEEKVAAQARSARLRDVKEQILKSYSDAQAERDSLYAEIYGRSPPDEVRRLNGLNEQIAQKQQPTHQTLVEANRVLKSKRATVSESMRATLEKEINRNAAAIKMLEDHQEAYVANEARKNRGKILNDLQEARNKMFLGAQTGRMEDNAPYEVRLERTRNLLARMDQIVQAREATKGKAWAQREISRLEKRALALKAMQDHNLQSLSVQAAEALGLPPDEDLREAAKAELLSTMETALSPEILAQYEKPGAMSAEAMEALPPEVRTNIPWLKSQAAKHDAVFNQAIDQLTGLDHAQAEAQDRLLGYELPSQGWKEWFEDVGRSAIEGREAARFGRESPRQLLYDKMFADQGVSLWEAYRALIGKLGEWASDPSQLLEEVQMVPKWAYEHPNLTRDMLGDLAHALAIAASSSDEPDHFNVILARLRAEGIASDLLVGDRTDARDKPNIPKEVLALLHLSSILPLVAQQVRYPRNLLGTLAGMVPVVGGLLEFVGNVVGNAFNVQGQRAVARALPVGSDAMIDAVLGLRSGEEWQSVMKKYTARQGLRLLGTQARDIFEDGWGAKIKNILTFKDARDWWKNASTKEKVWTAVTEFGVPAAVGGLLALAGGPVGIVLAVLAAVAVHFGLKFINNGLLFKGTQTKINKARAAERIKLALAKKKDGNNAYADYIEHESRNLGIPKAQLAQQSADYMAGKLLEVRMRQEKGELPTENMEAALTAAIETDIAEDRTKRVAAKAGQFQGPQLGAVPVSQRATFLAEMEDQLFSPQRVNGRTVLPEWNDKARQKIQKKVKDGD